VIEAASYGAAITSFICGLVALHLLFATARFKQLQWLLAAFFGLFSVLLVLTTIQLNAPQIRVNQIKIFSTLLFLSVGYLCCRTMARPRHLFSVEKVGWHLLPIALAGAVAVFSPGQLFDVVVIVVEVAYVALLVRLVAPGPSAIDYPRRFQMIAYRWTQIFLIFYCCLLVADIAIAIQMSDGRLVGQSSALVVTMGGLFIVAAFVGLGAMGQNSVFAWLTEKPPVRTAKPPISPDEESRAFTTTVVQTIAAPQNYGDEDLTITKLAKRMGVPARKVSEAINRDLSCSFSELLSRERIKAAKKLMETSDGRGMSIIDVAFEVGFRSKSNFNKEFKKITGCTPSEYRGLAHSGRTDNDIGSIDAL